MTQTYISIITGHTIRQYKNDILIYGAFYRYICKSPLIPFCIWKKAEVDDPILQLGAKAQRGKNNFPRSIPNLSTPSLCLLKLNILSCLQRQLMLTDTYEFWEIWSSSKQQLSCLCLAWYYKRHEREDPCTPGASSVVESPSFMN